MRLEAVRDWLTGVWVVGTLGSFVLQFIAGYRDHQAQAWGWWMTVVSTIRSQVSGGSCR